MTKPVKKEDEELAAAKRKLEGRGYTVWKRDEPADDRWAGLHTVWEGQLIKNRWMDRHSGQLNKGR